MHLDGPLCLPPEHGDTAAAACGNTEKHRLHGWFLGTLKTNDEHDNGQQEKLQRFLLNSCLQQWTKKLKS